MAPNTTPSTAHTLRNYRTASYRSELCDTKSFEQWTDDGAKDMQQRAFERWNSLLAEYQAPPLDPAIDEQLIDFIARRKRAAKDQWY